MFQKKNIQNNDNNEIDLLKIVSKCWYHKKLIIAGTIVVTLLSTFILILSNDVFKQDKNGHITAILKSDYGINNNRIISAYKSTGYVQNTLDKLSIDLKADQLLQYLFVENATDPLTSRLKDLISSLDNKDIKSASLSNDGLAEIYKNLNNTSKNLITLNLYYLPLNLSILEAKNFINMLTTDINHKILLNTNREDLGLSLIDVNGINSYESEYEQLARLSNISSSVQKNLQKMNLNHKELLFNYDLSSLTNLVNMSQQRLYSLSDKLGNFYSIENLKLNIKKIERDIEDLKNNLNYLDNPKSTTPDFNDLKDDNSFGSPVDGKTFDRILSIGSELNLNEYRIETLKILRELQVEKNVLLKQEELQRLSLEFDQVDVGIDFVGERINKLATTINQAVNQIRSFTQPKKAVGFIRNPELVKTSFDTNIVRTVSILSLLSLLCLSFIAILIPNRKKKKR